MDEQAEAQKGRATCLQSRGREMKWWSQDWNPGTLPFQQSPVIRAQPLEPDCLALNPRSTTS